MYAIEMEMHTGRFPYQNEMRMKMSRLAEKTATKANSINKIILTARPALCLFFIDHSSLFKNLNCTATMIPTINSSTDMDAAALAESP